MIVLFNPQSSASSKAILPMSVLSLAAVLEGKHDYAIVDGNTSAHPLDELRSHLGDQADILAMTVMPGRQVKQAVEFSRAIKAEFPAVSIVWGGYFPTMYPDVCIAASFVDFILRGHSEIAFVRLVEAIASGSDWRNKAGLSWRDSSTGESHQNPLGPVPDLNTLPDYPYHRIDMESYVLDTFLGSRTISHHASYGCPFTCNFCGVVSMVNGLYSAQDPETLERSVAALVQTYDANAVQFYDNNFFVSESRIAEICERLKKYDIAWWAYGRVDTLMKYKDRTWALMRDSGLKMVYLGVEAGSDETLDRMNKGGRQTADLGLEIAQRMQSHGIVPEMSFVIGCPPEAEEDIERTFQYIRRIKQVNAAAEIILYPYTPVPVEGELFDSAKSFGFTYPDTVEEWAEPRWIQFSERTTAALPWLTPAVQRKIGDFQRVLHAAYPTGTDPKLTGARRALLRLAGMWRYRLRFYRYPLELKVLARIMPHKRPEVTGF